MQCYECLQKGRTTQAIALCNYCSVALCAEHANVLPYYITTVVPVCKTVSLPKTARQILCGTCRSAIEQPRLARSA